MSNVHTLNEIGRYNENQRKQKESRTNSPQREQETDRLIEARDEFRDSPFKSTLAFLFPYFKFKSITFGYLCICILAYIIEWVMFSRHDWN